MGSAGLIIGLAWAMLAAASGLLLAAVAATLFDSDGYEDRNEYCIGYDALEGVVDRYQQIA